MLFGVICKTATSKQIDYPGASNYSSFSYDGQGQKAKIAEIYSGTVTSTKQFITGIWALQPSEERDGTGAVVKKFFACGQLNGSSNYFYTLDQLSSVREMTDNSGSLVSDRIYDTYGRRWIIAETVSPDFGFCSYYCHMRSELHLMIARSYSSFLGRFTNRDPLGEETGVNLFAYVSNNPISYLDPTGLFNTDCNNPCANLADGSWWIIYNGRPLKIECKNGNTKYIGYSGQPGAGTYTGSYTPGQNPVVDKTGNSVKNNPNGPGQIQTGTGSDSGNHGHVIQIPSKTPPQAIATPGGTSAVTSVSATVTIPTVQGQVTSTGVSGQIQGSSDVTGVIQGSSGVSGQVITKP